MDQSILVISNICLYHKHPPCFYPIITKKSKVNTNPVIHQATRNILKLNFSPINMSKPNTNDYPEVPL